MMVGKMTRGSRAETTLEIKALPNGIPGVFPVSVKRRFSLSNLMREAPNLPACRTKNLNVLHGYILISPWSH
jgi:hypothetical protein